MTQADKIRAMTDAELALALSQGDGVKIYPSPEHELRWLKQEIPAPPQKEPLCLSCAHANISVTDDFADCLCEISGGCEGGKTECESYERRT